MRAGAPYGNKNAEKWTLKKATKLYEDAIELSNKKTKVSNNVVYEYDFLGEIARELGTSKDIFTDLVDKFSILKRKYKVLKTNIEANCFTNAKRGKIKEGMAIANLKSNHNWTDRSENKQTTTMNLTIKAKNKDEEDELNNIG